MQREEELVPSSNSSVRVLTRKQDDLSLQYTLELPNRKRNVINHRMIIVVVAVFSLFYYQKMAIFIIPLAVIFMLYMEMTKICRETVTVIKDTCITYSSANLFGRKMFQSVPLNRLLGVVLIETIVGSRVHGILNLIVRIGEQSSRQIPLFTSLRPNMDTTAKIRHGILSYTNEVVTKNIQDFGEGNIMVTPGAARNRKQVLKEALETMRLKKKQ